MASPGDPPYYNIEGCLLPVVSSLRNPGVTIEHRLATRPHTMAPSKSSGEKDSEKKKSAQTAVKTILRCFFARSTKLYPCLYTRVVLSQLLFCSPVWRPGKKGLISALEGVQRCFLKRLNWRCNLNPDQTALSTLTAPTNRNDGQAPLNIIHRGDVATFFNIRLNNLRSNAAISPSSIAHTEHVNHQFTWRIYVLISERCTSTSIFL